ncbi:MAG: hypothetical protein FJ087_13555 [Deltaproteobacteria bacterium]|nr:hypothetical protein [Deltaproteobacteria bacterium]
MGRPYGRQSFSVLSALLKEAGVPYHAAALFEDHLRLLRQGLARERVRRVERDAQLRDLHDGTGGLATRIVPLADPPPRRRPVVGRAGARLGGRACARIRGRGEAVHVRAGQPGAVVGGVDRRVAVRGRPRHRDAPRSRRSMFSLTL